MPDKDLYNRANVRVLQDERILEFRHAPLMLTLPQAGIFDAPLRCYPVNEEWAKIITGAVSLLLEISAWKDATDEDYAGIRAIQEFLVGDFCMDCNGVENCLSTSQIIANLQAAIAANTSAINTNANGISTNQQNLATLQSSFDDLVNIDIPQINLSIQANADNITANNGLIQQNNDLIGINAQQITLLDNRVTALENSGGSGGNSVPQVKVTVYTFDVATTITLTTAYQDIMTQSHQFTYNTAWIHHEVAAHAGGVGTITFNQSVNAVNGNSIDELYSDTVKSVEINNLFSNIDTSQPVDVVLKALRDTYGQIDSGNTIQLVIFEYAVAPISPANPTVTFDTGGQAYTILSDANGYASVQTIGGNPDGCFAGANLPQGFSFEIQIDLGAAKAINGIQLDIFSSDFASTDFYVSFDGNYSLVPAQYPTGTDNQYHTFQVPAQYFPQTAQLVTVGISCNTIGQPTLADLRLDNVVIDTGGL